MRVQNINIFELLSAWSWSEQFDLVEKFDILQDNIADHGFEDFCNDRDLQLKTCAGIISGKTTPKSIMDLKGDEIRSRFDEIEKGILGALDYLKRELHIKHFKMIPFPALLVPLSAFFATNKSEGVSYTAKQNAVIKKWFWRAMFNRRFSSDVNERQSTDITNMIALRNDENYDFRFSKDEIKFDFIKSNFSSVNANSKTFILLLNSITPLSLLSGAKIDLDKVLKKASKHEYHHIFPKKYLESLNENDVNSLANICFLTRSDNNNIRDAAPHDYIKKIEASKKDEYLNSSFIPLNFDTLNYKEFLQARVELLESYARKLMS